MSEVNQDKDSKKVGKNVPGGNEPQENRAEDDKQFVVHRII